MQAGTHPPRARVSLGRLNMETCVPRDQAATAGLGSDPAGAFGKDLSAALAAGLSPLCDTGDPSVWVIRRLDIELAGGRAWHPGKVAEALAGEIGARLSRIVAGEVSDGAVRFPDRAAYLGQFLVDLIDGDAFERWYFGHFTHLRALPRGIAACMALEAEPEHAFRALAAILRRGRLPVFLSGLSDREALRIGEALVSQGLTPHVSPTILMKVASRIRSGSFFAKGKAKAHLQALIEIAVEFALPPGTVAAALDEIGYLIRDEIASPAVEDGVGEGDIDHDGPSSGDDGAVASRRLKSLLKRLAVKSRPNTRHRPLALPPQGIVTPRAGVFLLWRSVMELGLDAALVSGSEEAAARRHRLALALSGPSQDGAEEDEALRWLTRGATLAALSDAEAAELQVTLFETLTGLRPARPLDLVLRRDDDVFVLQDAWTQDWYAARQGGIPPLPDAEIASIVVERGVQAPSGCAEWKAVPLADERFTLLSPVPATGDRIVRAIDELRPIGSDIDYLTGGRPLDLAELTVALVARAAYADLGRRLPGLALSSAAYLGRNAVHGIGRLLEKPPHGEADAEVALPSVPFDFIRLMTGLPGTVYALADGRRVKMAQSRVP